MRKIRPQASEPPLERVEFQREALGLLPAPDDTQPGTAIRLAGTADGPPLRTCTCATAKGGLCHHAAELEAVADALERRFAPRTWNEVFAASFWFRLAEALGAAEARPCSELRVVAGPPIALAAGAEIAVEWLGDAGQAARLLDRVGKTLGGIAPLRAWALDRIAQLGRTPEEIALNESGARTRRQAFDASLWGRLAYHCFRELDGASVSFHPAIDRASGAFTVECRNPDRPLFRLVVPRARVRSVLALLERQFPGQPDLAVRPVPLRSLFRVTAATDLDLDVRPALEALGAGGERIFLERADVERFRYGDLVFVPDLGILAELERSGRERKFAAPIAMKLRRSQVASFLAEHREALRSGALVLDDPGRRLAVLDDFDRIEVVPEALERSWFWLSIHYGYGDHSVALAEILAARREGVAYLETPAGWIDVRAPGFRALETFENRPDLLDPTGRVRLAPLEFLRLASSAAPPVEVTGPRSRAAVLERLLEGKPGEPFRDPRGLRTPLRGYQRRGAAWLAFLWEHNLGGLLCDDMGLGKTHQSMALLAWLAEHRRGRALVVCPTTVLPHWRDKLRDHAPGLQAAVYHGIGRDIEAARAADVVVTSYGILRNDILELRRLEWTAAVFDEIQNLKNRDTVSYEAAAALEAPVKIGLTGTPIENALAELKSLFDLVLPGYLGSDREFAARSPDEVRRIVRPFVLRRTKVGVLQELPEKIEDLRTCCLSEEQVKLYRDALAAGSPLVERVRAGEGPLPYIHIFALLTLLKRVCDHPALVAGQPEDYAKHRSGKWDLFEELLFESLDSGQKVVIFSQFVGMLTIMARYLADIGVRFAELTGATCDRAGAIRRFNEDPDCRVFLGSLRAGGTGIDLVAGTVVIHYDRWWNAAREDQATDRVHRIGQRRAVSVFKLVTEGTLEEKISAIIERKRHLSESVVRPEEKRLDRIYTREEMLDLLGGI